MWAVEARFGKPKIHTKDGVITGITIINPSPYPTHLQKEAIMVENLTEQVVGDVDPGIVTFASGASRSKLMSWFTFVPRYFIQRIADVFRYGAKKYGIRNWQKGDQDFIDEIPDHIINHVYEYLEEVNTGGSGKDKEDHLANIGCNLVMLMHFQKQGKFPQRTQG